MKNYKSGDVRNVAIVGGSGSGKTTLTESILLNAGVVRRRGTVNAKNTVSDTAAVEQEYGYSVYSTVCSVECGDRKLNFFDCPGSDDFSGASVTALNMCDSAVLLMNGQYNMEVGSINNHRLIRKLGKPVFFAVNYVDNEKCEYDNIVEAIRSQFGGGVYPVQFPETSGPGFKSVIDVLSMKRYTYTADGAAPQIDDVPAALADKAQTLHDALVEAAAENDEALMDKFFDQGELSDEEILTGLRKGVASDSFFPVLCLSAAQNVGVSGLVDFVCNMAPSPLDVAPVSNTKDEEVKPTSDGATSLFFFKTCR